MTFCLEQNASPIDVQANLRAILGSVSDHHTKANIAIKWVTRIFCFLVHRIVIYTIFCSQLSVQEYDVWKMYMSI